MRKALVIGIDYYTYVNSLSGCVNDAYAVKQVLERHGDGTKNFDVEIITATDESSAITKSILLKEVKELFEDISDVALFYYAGHGYIQNDFGYINPSDSRKGEDGLSMEELLDIVNDSKAQNKVVILDSCFSGQFGNSPSVGNKALLTEGTTILTASSASQVAGETNSHGIFTNLLIDALNGSACNLVGEITPGSVYAHIDQSLGAWSQRPIFKTNVRSFVSLRNVVPPISLADLKRITELFPIKGEEFKLDPTYEPQEPSHIKEHTEQFSILQKYNRLNLVVPIGAPHMYYAAVENKSCKLTILGEHYWDLVKNDRI